MLRSQAEGYHDRGMDEAALIQEAKRGDLESFNRLVLQHQGLAYNVAYRVLGDPASAEDATQDAFLSAYRAIRRFRGGSFRAWLMRIVTNACYDELRRRKRRPAASLEALTEDLDGIEADEHLSLASGSESPEQAAERAELARAIHHCLEGLPADFRVVAVLSDVQGFGYREIAEAIGKPLGTVKSRLARARARMRDCLESFGELIPASYRLESETIG